MRAFTLIEVLAAVVLLALMTALVLPFFQGASDVLGRQNRSVEGVALLGAAATRLMASPEWEKTNRTGEVSLAWPPELADMCGRSEFRGKQIAATFPPELSPPPPEVRANATDAAPRGTNDRRAHDERARGIGDQTDDGADDGKDEPQTDVNGSPPGAGVPGLWIEFRCGDVSVHRWVALPRNDRSKRRQRRRRGTATREVHLWGRSCGMTLVEVVVALALFGALAIAAAGWTTTAAQLAQVSKAKSNQRSAGEAALRLIADDLRCHDAESAGSNAAQRAGRRSSEPVPRVRVEGDALIVRVRDPDAGTPVAEHRYAVPSSSGTLERFSGQQSSRPLVDGVHALVASFDEKSRLLTVAIEFDDGEQLGRTYLVP